MIRYGSHVGLNEGRIKVGQYLFHLHGGKIVLFGRFFPVLRIWAAVLAGSTRWLGQSFLYSTPRAQFCGQRFMALALTIWDMR